MGQETTRLRRLIADELGDCRDSDVEQRADALEELSAEIPENYSADIDAFKTLGNDTRYRLVRFLDAADGELCV